MDINRYAYAGNDPVNGADPSGHIVLADDVVVATAVAIVASAVVGYHYYELATNPEYKESLTSTINQATSAAQAGISSLGEKLASALGLNNDAIENQTDEQIEQGIKSHEGRIEEHKDKLEEYTKNPDSMDHKGKLSGAKTPEIRDKIIRNRKQDLLDTIEKHRQEIAKKKAELEKRRKEKEERKQDTETQTDSEKPNSPGNGNDQDHH